MRTMMRRKTMGTMRRMMTTMTMMMTMMMMTMMMTMMMMMMMTTRMMTFGDDVVRKKALVFFTFVLVWNKTSSYWQHSSPLHGSVVRLRSTPCGNTLVAKVAVWHATATGLSWKTWEVGVHSGSWIGCIPTDVFFVFLYYYMLFNLMLIWVVSRLEAVFLFKDAFLLLVWRYLFYRHFGARPYHVSRKQKSNLMTSTWGHLSRTALTLRLLSKTWGMTEW